MDEARAAMAQADVLVNIGNSVDNQFLSKIFEYFSTGKPVIHLQKTANCPCVAYMCQYENALILPEETPAADAAERAARFCLSDRRYPLMLCRPGFRSVRSPVWRIH